MPHCHINEDWPLFLGSILANKEGTKLFREKCDKLTFCEYSRGIIIYTFILEGRGAQQQPIRFLIRMRHKMQHSDQATEELSRLTHSINSESG